MAAKKPVKKHPTLKFPPSEFDAVFIAMDLFFARGRAIELNYNLTKCLLVRVEKVMIRHFLNMHPDEEDEPTIYLCVDPEILKWSHPLLYAYLRDTLVFLEGRNFTIVNLKQAEKHG